MNKSIILFAMVLIALLVIAPKVYQKDGIVNAYPDETILNLSEDAGVEYIDKIYFVGDSTTYHFHKGGIDRNKLLVPPQEKTLWLQSDILNIKVTKDGLTITQALKKYGAQIVIITLGINGAADFSKLEYSTYYKKLINAIKSECPNTEIILQSVFPVTEEYSNENRITNDVINKINKWVFEIARDTSVKYLNTHSVLTDENGAQIKEYSESDGIHMNSAAYEQILFYIRTHAIDQEII